MRLNQKLFMNQLSVLCRDYLAELEGASALHVGWVDGWASMDGRRYDCREFHERLKQGDRLTPDLEDDVTRLSLIKLVREVLADPNLHVEPDGEQWVALSRTEDDDWLVYGRGETEIEAVVEALESAAVLAVNSPRA